MTPEDLVQEFEAHAAACRGLAQTLDGPGKVEAVARANTWQQAADRVEQLALPFDFAAHLQRQRDWSERTFGPGVRLGVVEHIRKELTEVEADPTDLREWIDVVILGLDGAWRAGWTPAQIINALVAKQTKNEARVWPDWRTMPTNQAIEHDRGADAAVGPPPKPEDRESDALFFTVEVDADGCSQCNAGKTWTVVGPPPESVAHSQSFSDQEDAEALCDSMNLAFEAGRAAAGAAREAADRAVRAHMRERGPCTTTATKETTMPGPHEAPDR